MNIKLITINEKQTLGTIGTREDVLVFQSPSCEVLGDIYARVILARGNLKVNGDIHTESMEVLVNLEASGDVTASDSIKIGGNATAKSISAQWGLIVKGKITSNNIKIGTESGAARCQIERFGLPIPEGWPKNFFGSEKTKKEESLKEEESLAETL